MRHFALLDSLGVIRVSGADARSFLQGQFTADFRMLGFAHGTLAAWCSPQGRVLFLAYVLPDEGGFLLVLPTSMLAQCVKRLRMYVLRAAVTVELLPTWTVAGLYSPEADSAPTPPFTLVNEYGVARLALPGSGERWLVVGPHDLVGELAGDAGAGAPDDWLASDIAAGLPLIEGAASDRFLPQQLNLDLLGVMSFDKGCYPGQEVIARLRYRGEVKQRARAGRSAAMLAPGQKLHAPGAATGQSAGEIVQTVTVDGVHHCLAVVDLAAPPILHLASPDGPTITLAPPFDWRG